MQVIRSNEELDAKITACNEAEKRSEEEMRAIMGSFRMEVPKHLPRDPFSPEYRDAQLALYRDIAGKPYSTQAEATKFDPESLAAKPFPFYTKSSAVAGEYFMAIGYVLHTMALPPNSRVLEFGAGWGYTSLALALLGHQVTVIDIEPCFCELIRIHAKRAGVDIEVINADFFSIETMAREFDAALFYDCFHHCDDHLRLLKGLKHVIAPNGRIFFGAEPITPDFPMPWGLRLDGWALWGIRKNGWMELGFHDDYFSRALEKTGWSGRKVSLSGSDRLRLWEGTHKFASRWRFAVNSGDLHTEVGQRAADRIALTNAKAGAALFGPYVELPAGRYRAQILLADNAPASGTATMDVVCNKGKTQLAQREIDFSKSEGNKAVLDFSSIFTRRGIEVRLISHGGLTAAIEAVEIEILS